MESIVVTIIPEDTRTRVLAVKDGEEVLRAVLPPVSTAHNNAVATFIEGLALWEQRQLSVVLCVDEEETSCCAFDLGDALGLESPRLHFEAELTYRQLDWSRPPPQAGVDDFRELRQIARAAVDSGELL